MSNHLQIHWNHVGSMAPLGMVGEVLVPAFVNKMGWSGMGPMPYLSHDVVN